MKLKDYFALLLIASTITSCVYWQEYELIEANSTNVSSGDSDYWYNAKSKDVVIRFRLTNHNYSTAYFGLAISNHGESPVRLKPSKILIWDEDNLHKEIHFEIDGASHPLNEIYELASGADIENLVVTNLRVPKEKDWADTIYVLLGDFISSEGVHVFKSDMLKFVPTRPN